MISAYLLLSCGISSDYFFAEALTCITVARDENGRIYVDGFRGLAEYLLASGCTIICRSESYWGLFEG